METLFNSPIPNRVVGALIAGLFGLLAGSFANVVIHRLPLEQSIVFPSSRCPACLAAIRPWQNIPLLSWLLLRGRCASCGQPISGRYPLVELLHGLGFGSIVWKFGPQPFTLFFLFFFFALVVLAFIDWDHQILPDVITLPGILIGLCGAFVPGAMVSWKDAGLAAFMGYLAFFLVAEGYARLRGVEGLGQGDWKLAAMMGAFLGGQRLMLIVFLASLSGTIYGLIQATRLRRRRASLSRETATSPGPLEAAVADVVRLDSLTRSEVGDAPSALPVEESSSVGSYRLPFGTFLATSAIFVLFVGDPLLAWYASLFRF